MNIYIPLLKDTKSLSERKARTRDFMERKKFMCKVCKWKFVRNFTPMLCPYCGKTAVVLADVEKMVLKVQH